MALLGRLACDQYANGFKTQGGFFKQKTAYEMESRDWSSDVCSSDLEQALDVLERDPQLWAVVVSPWVMVQERAQE